jgi:hypothetical protein
VSGRTPDGKRTRELLRRLPPGFSLENKAHGHLVVLQPDGEPLRMADGLPVRVTSTAGGKGIERDLARIRKALRGKE